MHAADIMTPDVICAAPETTVAQLIQLMVEHGISALPVLEHGQIVGIVSEADLLERPETGTERPRSRWLELVTPSSRLAAKYSKSHGRKASEIMTRDVVVIPDTMPIAEIVQLFGSHRIKRVPVTRDGKLVGIISRRNLLQALACSLPDSSAMTDDRTIREAFYAELRHQSWVDGPGTINAIVSDGVIHLWGVVPDEARHQAIIVAAENIPGVRMVADHLDLPPVIDPLNRPNWPSPVPP